MIGTFLFYLTCSLRNRLLSRFRRLRQPKYLISALAGLGYLYVFLFRQVFSRQRGHAAVPPIGVGPDMLSFLQTGLALALLVVVLLPWVWPGRGEGIRFTEAEIQFLFSAPVSRRSLIRFRLAKAQLGILFGTLISFVIFGRGRLFDHPAYFLTELWVVYSFLAFYNVGTSLTKMSLSEHGTSGLRRQLWALALIAVFVVSVVIWARWFVAFPPGLQLEDFPAWFAGITGAGPARYFLAPFLALVRPAFAGDPLTFLLRLIPALGILVLTYLWVMRSDTAFEEAALERARKTAQRLEAARGGIAGAATSARKVRRPPFELAPRGFAHTAIFWKNVISVGRIDLVRVIPALVFLGIGLAVALSKGAQREFLPAMIGTLAAMMAGFLTLLGPVMVRDDLRSDLLQVDQLKTWPIAGWSIVLGEVLAPAVVLALGEWLLLIVAVVSLPSLGRVHPSAFQRLLAGASAAFLLPGFSLIGLLIQNAAALIMPAWVQLGKEHKRGIEAMGQRLITMAATVLLLLFAVVPAAVLFAVVFLSGYWLVGLAVLPLAALLAALGLLVEAGIAVWWLGRLFDRFDVSLEGAAPDI